MMHGPINIGFTTPSFLSRLTSSYIHLVAINTVGCKDHDYGISSEGYYLYQVRESQSNYAKVEMVGHAQARAQTLLTP